MPAHLTLAELEAALPDIAASPADDGVLSAVVIRPRAGEREEVTFADVSSKRGVHGDSWSKRCRIRTPSGAPHPDAQISIMNARAIAAIAVERSNWAGAGDNLFVDLDLSPENLPPGQRLAIGTAVIEITPEAHTGCSLFARRYGRDAKTFVNTGAGRSMRLRGVYARVVRDGRVSAGDRVRKALKGEDE